MGDTLKIGHAPGCARRHGAWVIEPCACDYERAQELAAENTELRKLLDPAILRLARVLEWNEAHHPGACCNKCAEGLSELETLRRLAGEYLKAEEVVDRDVTDRGHWVAMATARRALAAHLREKP